jgi:acylphosphatase
MPSNACRVWSKCATTFASGERFFGSRLCPARGQPRSRSRFRRISKPPAKIGYAIGRAGIIVVSRTKSKDDTAVETAISTEARLRISIRGAVQGVGFRPFVHRLATNLKLAGWVNNSTQGVTIEVEGQREVIEKFLLSLPAEKPPRSSIQSLESSWLEPVGYGQNCARPSRHRYVRRLFARNFR